MGFQPGLHIKKREGKERMEEIEGEKERRGEREEREEKGRKEDVFSLPFFFLSMKRSAATKDLMHLFFFQYAEKF